MTTVLVVDDQQNIRSVIKACLEESEHLKVLEAEDGLAAIDCLAQTQCDLVITDLNMPMMNGFELTGYMRKHNNLSKIPIVMLTSISGEAIRKQAFAIGVDDFLVKPFSPESLLPVVNKHLR